MLRVWAHHWNRNKSMQVPCILCATQNKQYTHKHQEGASRLENKRDRLPEFQIVNNFAVCYWIDVQHVYKTSRPNGKYINSTLAIRSNGSLSSTKSTTKYRFYTEQIFSSSFFKVVAICGSYLFFHQVFFIHFHLNTFLLKKRFHIKNGIYINKRKVKAVYFC